MEEKVSSTSLEVNIAQEVKRSVVINFVINAAIAYSALKNANEVAAWDVKGFGQDLVLTGFVLCVIVSAIYISMYRKRVASNEVVVEGFGAQSVSWVFPYNRWSAALVMGVFGALIAAPLMLGVLMLFGLGSVTPLGYAIAKGAWAAILAYLIVPVSIRQGLRVRSV